MTGEDTAESFQLGDELEAWMPPHGWQKGTLSNYQECHGERFYMVRWSIDGRDLTTRRAKTQIRKI
jgi:hypothetical protein